MGLDASYSTKNYRGQGGDNDHVSGTLDIESGGALTVKSGATLTVEAGATLALQDASYPPDTIALADGHILVGDAGGDAADVAMTGDVTISNAGVTAIGAGKVVAAMLAAGAGIAALLTAGLGNALSYLKTKNDTTDLLAANATKDRAVLVVVTVDEAFADNGGNQPTFTVGEEATLNKFFDTAAFTNKAAGTVLTTGAVNLTNKKVQVTGVAAVGAGTGGITVTVLAIPTT